MSKRGFDVRRLFQFRLRSLLVILTVGCVWLGFHVNATRQQKDVSQHIRNYGGWVRYDFQFPSGSYDPRAFDGKAKSWLPLWALDSFGVDFFHSIVQVYLIYSDDSGTREENPNRSDDAMRLLPRLPNLRVLALADTQATDASMPDLAQLHRLESLYMWDVPEVSDKGVEYLSGLKELRYIHITTSQITDESMQVFAQLPKLQHLSLQGNRFSNDALKHIRGLKNLKTLFVGLGECTIDDAGLVHLKQLTKLEMLGIQESRIAGPGLKELQHLKSLKELCVGNKVSQSAVESLNEKLPLLNIRQ